MKFFAQVYSRNFLYIIFLLSTPTMPALADEVRIAVASNFSTTIMEVASAFENQSGHKVTLIIGATGRHYAQIRNGAPFDAFFAADQDRPQKLEEAGVVQPGSRFTYALGKLVLWSPEANLVDASGECLKKASFDHLAIANSRLAPYGKAARETLQKLGLWQPLSSHLVRGENIGQTFQFVVSGNAQLGFVAWSQLKNPDHPRKGSFWKVPETLYSPIKQQAVLLSEEPAARAFMAFVKTPAARQIIRNHGYGIP